MDCVSCGRRMVLNGRRETAVVDLVSDRAVAASATSLRFRCAVCGRSGRATDPELHTGFRLTASAAARIVELSCSVGPEATSQTVGIDRATVSRLLAAERGRTLAEVVRPEACRLVASSGSTVVVADALTGVPAAVFESIEDPLLGPWLAAPHVPVIIADQTLVADLRSRPWGKAAAVGRAAFEVLAASAVARSARRLAASVGSGRGARALARILGKPRLDLDRAELDELRRVALPGTRERGFMALRDRLLSVHAARTLPEARAALAAWRRDCTGFWARVFAPVLSFLDGLSEAILSTPLSIRPLPAVPDPAPALRSAAARTLAVRRAVLPGPILARGCVPAAPCPR